MRTRLRTLIAPAALTGVLVGGGYALTNSPPPAEVDSPGINLVANDGLRITGEGVRVRSGPSATAPVIGRVDRGDRLRPDCNDGGYVRGKLPGHTNPVYVAVQFVNGGSRLTPCQPSTAETEAQRRARTEYPFLVRTGNAPANLWALPNPLPNDNPMREIAANTTFRVACETGEGLQTRTPDGVVGYVLKYATTLGNTKLPSCSTGTSNRS